MKDISNPMTVYEKKSKRERTFPISEQLYKNLTFLSAYGKDSDYVFQSHHKHGVSVHRSTIHRKIKKALKWQENDTVDASAHSARKLYAQNIMDETGSVKKVQEALQHQKLSTTLAYLEKVRHNGKSTEEIATERPKNKIFSRFIDFMRKLFYTKGS